MIKRYIKLIVGIALATTAGLLAILWLTCRVYVPPDQCAVLIRKMGTELPPGQLVATEPGQRGIQADVLGPGRHYRDPIRFNWELKDLTVIPSGDPATWEWIHSLDASQRDQLRAGKFEFKGRFPKIGVVTRKVGIDPPPGQTIVTRESGMRGILAEVLTPGTYKINPYLYEVELYPAVVIPAGFVGVVTNLFGEQPEIDSSEGLSELAHGVPDDGAPEAEGEGATSAPVETVAANARPLAKPGQRGTLADVIQPGVYFINPKLQKVTPIEIGFNEYSQVKTGQDANYRISFPSDTGYLIRVGVTVVWGIHPQHASSIINDFGNVDRVLDKVIGPRLRSICRNIGSTYAARDFIQGEKREKFQQEMTKELQRVCRRNNVEVLLALVREIEVHAPQGGEKGDEVTEDLKRTIQQSYIAIEKQITKEQQREAATVKAHLEEIQKQVEIAREMVKADTRVMVANTGAGAEKEAAEVDAQAALEIATIQQQVAELDAKRIEILGRARTDVEKLKNSAEAQGYKLLVDAFGSPQAYNLYTFAENFDPQSIQLFYAGDGTFWTDLSRFEEVGAAKLLQKTPKSASVADE
ncbi:MAG: SPFH domain-containing protein [Planctomycetota bacterium]